MARLLEERRRLKERYPSLALVDLDTREVRSSLASYDVLLEARDICEGSCGRGEACPTGMCRPPGPKKLEFICSYCSKQLIYIFN